MPEQLDKPQVAEVDIELLADLLNYRRQYFKICDKFQIQVERRGEHWVGEGIIQKFDNYKTGYTLRKEVAEKAEDAITPLPDPEINNVQT